MALDRIILTDFRNHPETRLQGARRINLLIGENGAGKTNVLEALSLLAPGRGLRRASLADMARSGSEGGFAVSALLSQGNGIEPVRLGTGTGAERPGRRIVRVNAAEASAAGLAERLAISWLTPAMDTLFTGSASARRRYLDRLTLALEPGHARIAARYEAALRERNRLLTGDAEPDTSWLTPLEGELAEAGLLLREARARIIIRLSDALAAMPDEPFAKPALALQCSGPADRAALAATRLRDRAAGRTLEGAHRDELDVLHAAKDTPAALASTGEQKAMLIALTLAHARLAADGRPGLLLLDEIAAHLDPVRRGALFERLAAGPAQVWLTGTELAPFETIADQAAVWQVTAGQAVRV